MIYENAKLRAQLFKKVSVQKDNKCGTSMNTKFAKQSILGKPPKLDETHGLSKPITSNSIPTPQESKVVKNDKVIAPGMFRINPFKTSRWSPTGRMFDLNGKIIASSKSKSQSDYSKGDNACTSNHVEPTIKWFPNATFSLAGQFYDSDLEVAFRRNTCFVKNLEGVYLLKGDRSKNLYTINLHEMASASPICLMARTSSTKSWLWQQRLSHLNFDTINDLVKNDLVSGLLKFKYHKEHLCPLCEQGKRKRASHPPKPVPNSRQRLHLLHMDLYGPMRIASINGKWYVLVWMITLVILGVYNRRTKKIMETMNVSFDELSTMAFEQRSSKPELQSMTSGQISSGLDLIYDTLTITTQQPTEGKLDLLFEALYDDYIGGFIDADHPSHVYKLKKALYGLKQAPRAWRFHDDVLVVQVYVDDIIFGSTHSRYIQLFSDLMKMSMMREMTFFFGLQVNQSPCGIFINQSKYVLEILKKYGMESCDPVGTPLEIKDKLDLDQNGTPVDATKYQSMIGALMYLTSSRPDIVYATYLCTRYQAKPTEKHLKEVKRIFRYLRGTINTDTFKSTFGGAQFVGEKLLTDYGFSFNKIPIYCDSKSAIAISCNPVQQSRTKHVVVVDYAGCKDTFKSTFGGAQFIGEKLVSWSSKKQDCTALLTAEAEYVSLSVCCT
uniref:Retrovirus-related Pol polyprotein from transposon TNT 1-94 n=1 Tax=Tanacetum cinerariifolium TaxID=118510 RepID=A0A6L2NJ46_TANCI|nr:hypothetical protein [Tanacetum cinerariifolium]